MKTPQSKQPAKPPQTPAKLPYEDEVLRRMLSTPPKPHKAKVAPIPAKKVARKKQEAR